MQDVRSTMPAASRGEDLSAWARFLEYLPRGNTLDEPSWRRRHRMLEWVLALHVPALVLLGLALDRPEAYVAEAVVAPVVCLVLGHLVHHRRWASFFITGGLVFCSAALVLLSGGTIEAHFHFFIIIGFIALYQDWVPFLWNVTFTVLSHGIGTIWLGGQIFNHPAAQQHPWLWSFIHGVAVLLACVGMVIFWRVTEDEQHAKEALGRQLITADAEIGRRQFTSDMLINLARRNQSMLYRQLDIINHLEDKEQDPDALADLFALDHLATRVRRNAESLLVLAGEQSPRTWSAPVALRDVVRAAIAETEDLDRVVFAVDDQVALSGSSVADVTHLLAELTENAVRFSPPETVVTIRARPNRRDDGGQVLTVEDWGVGMPSDDLAEANELLTHPREVDLAVSQRLGFHVVARLAARHRIAVSLTATPGSGITAAVVLPSNLFTTGVPLGGAPPAPAVVVHSDGAAAPAGREADRTDLVPVVEASGNGATEGAWAGRAWTPAEPEPVVDAGPVGLHGSWHGWWSPDAPGALLPGELPPGFRADGPARRSTNGGSANGGSANGGSANGGYANGGPPNGSSTNGGGNGSGRYGRDGGSGTAHDAGRELGVAVEGNGHRGADEGVRHPHASGTDADGHSPNGFGPNGSSSNGFGSNGFGSNGFGPNGVSANGGGSNGLSAGPLDSGVSGSDLFAAGDAGRDAVGPDAVGLDGERPGPDAAVPGGRGEDERGDVVDDRPRPPSGAEPQAPRSTPPAYRALPPIPEGLLLPPNRGRDGDRSRPTDPAALRPESTTSAVDVPVARGGSPVASPVRRPVPAGGPSAMAALPSPRPGETAVPVAPSRGLPASHATTQRGLRRRVPQSHLAPELRHAANGLADTVAPLAADAAASALSRYQASRLAAQAIVDVPDGSRPEDEGGRP